MITFIRLVVIVLLVIGQDAFACTSFTVDGKNQNVLHGMNFDYPKDRRMGLFIKPGRMGNVFHLGFVSALGDMVMTAGMNAKGLFANMQMLYPEDLAGWPQGPEAHYFWDVYHKALHGCGHIKAVRELLIGHRLIQGFGVTLHSLFADGYGHGLIAEAGRKGNRILPKQEAFLVMTNFSNCDLRDTGKMPGNGMGRDRYKTARAFLGRAAGTMDVKRAMALLKDAFNRHPRYPTRCSLVFDPGKAQVYLALEGDFHKIWRISITSSYIETWQGFSTPGKLKIGPQGLMTGQLSSH